MVPRDEGQSSGGHAAPFDPLRNRIHSEPFWPTPHMASPSREKCPIDGKSFAHLELKNIKDEGKNDIEKLSVFEYYVNSGIFT